MDPQYGPPYGPPLWTPLWTPWEIDIPLWNVGYIILYVIGYLIHYLKYDWLVAVGIILNVIGCIFLLYKNNFIRTFLASVEKKKCLK